MKLSVLLKDISYKSAPEQDCEISLVTSDSRNVIPNALFVCVRGTRHDGHEFAQKALEMGAAAVVCDHDLGMQNQIVVEDTSLAYGVLCSAFYGHPSKKLKLIGVTGTNGKTTITNILKQMLAFLGHRVGLIGTIQNEIGSMVIPAKYTTPDAEQLQLLFSRMAAAGCEYVVMECSSHALDQQRVAGCHFEVGVFTNLTQDHLDYHGTMENYLSAKLRLFDQCSIGVVNYDDQYVKQFYKNLPCKTYTFSTESDEADYVARQLKTRPNGVDFVLLGHSMLERMHFCMPGKFSASNAMAACVTLLGLGFGVHEVSQALSACTGVTGRTEVLKTNTDYTIIRDYAHTPDGLEKVLSAIREFAPGRVVVLFGSAGNRDRTKRPLMGKAAGAGSDFAILTSDNPRSEDPMQIINDVLPGLQETKTPYEVIPDRYEAIKWALKHAQKDDVLILAGKGHEDYQVLKDGTVCFDEKEIVTRLLEQKTED